MTGHDAGGGPSFKSRVQEFRPAQKLKKKKNRDVVETGNYVDVPRSVGLNLCGCLGDYDCL